MDRKARINQLAGDLVRSNSHDAIGLKEMLGLLLDEAKDNLVATTGDDTIRMQGQAQAIIRLRRMVTEAPMTITPRGETK